MDNQGNNMKTYRVKLGHAEVLVSADSKEEAIAQARQLLSAQMPRFYDVIRNAATARFEVRDAA